jgi:transposase-like protein
MKMAPPAVRPAEGLRRAAADRAEQIRLGLQGTAVLYARAVAENDWQALGYKGVQAWAVAEFGFDRFSAERRREIVALLTDAGYTQRKIAAAVNAGHATVRRDQQALAGGPDGSQERPKFTSTDHDSTGLTGPLPAVNARQQAARDREARREQERVSALLAAERIVADGFTMPAQRQENCDMEGGEYYPSVHPAEQARREQELLRADAAAVLDDEDESLTPAVLPQPRHVIPARPAEQYVPAAVDALRRGLTQGQFGREAGLPDNSMVLSKAWGAAGERLRAEAAIAGQHAPAAVEELAGYQQVLAQWADWEGRLVAHVRDAGVPLVVLDDLIRRLAELRRALLVLLQAVPSHDTVRRMIRIEQAALHEKAAEQDRAQAETAWRQAWWQTTLALGEPADSDRKSVSAAYDIAERILGQSRTWLATRRMTGKALKDLVLEDKIFSLPTRLAVQYVQSKADPAQAVAVLQDAEARELSLRDFAAELGTQPQSWLREDEQHQRPVTPEQMQARPVTEQARVIQRALGNPEVARAVFRDQDCKAGVMSALRHDDRQEGSTATPSAPSPAKPSLTRLDVLIFLADAKDALRRASRLSVSLGLAGDDEVLSDLGDVETEAEQFRRYLTGMGLDEAIAKIMEGA